MSPTKDMSFLGPSKNMIFQEGNGPSKKHEVSRGKGYIKTHEIFGSIIQNEVSGGETQKCVQSTQGFRSIK